MLAIITPLVDPAKVDTLKGERASTPRPRKVCHWLEQSLRAGHDPAVIIEAAQRANGSGAATRDRIQREALLRNRTILERLGCLDAAGMDKLKNGKAPTITAGPCAGELATADHILPRSIVPELDNRLYNLEFLPWSLNEDKSNKIGDRQRQLARQWHEAGLLSDVGLRAIES